MRVRILFAAGLLFAGTIAANAQSVSVDKLSCLPTEENGVVRAAAGAAAGQSLRLYFRWMGHEDFYWVVMEPEANGRFWAVPPKPEKRNEHVELYAALVDPAGKVAARSETQTVKVSSDCRVQLNVKERGVADNLTVGETSPKQQGKKVLAFLCDGIVTRVNSEGVFLGCRFAVEAMAKAGSGSIINMSSMAAIRGFPQVIAYAASKGAVRSLSLTVAAHCLRVGLPGIRCNTILPGATLTPMQQRAHEGMREGATAAEVADPRNRVGQTSDIANLVVYLSSDESRHITGQEFVVDGGYSIW